MLPSMNGQLRGSSFPGRTTQVMKLLENKKQKGDKKYFSKGGHGLNMWRDMDDRLERRRELLIPRGVLGSSSAPQGVFGQATSDGGQSVLGSSGPQGLLDQASRTGERRDGKR